MADLSGDDLGRYHITALLGQGGMAVVYKAYDNQLEREVAIKVIRLVNFNSSVAAPLLERFEREARCWRR
jgi:serine/threonine-protein kinase